MIHKFFISLILILGLAFLSACKEEVPPEETGVGLLEVNIIPRIGGQLYEKNDEYINQDNRKYELLIAKLYVSQITLIKADGTEKIVKPSSTESEVVFFDLSASEARKTSHGEGVFRLITVDAGDYQGARISFGVPASINQTQPSDYSPDHPLGSNAGMYDANAGNYAFVHLKGNIDSSPNKTGTLLDWEFEYLIGGDTQFRTLEFIGGDYQFTVPKNEEFQYSVEIDLGRFFYNPNTQEQVDMINDHIRSTSEKPELAKKMIDSFTETGVYKPPF